MTPQDLSDYLTKLLGRSIAPDDEVRLTSGQQGRVGGWLAERGLQTADLRRRLSVPFRPAAFLGDDSVAAARAPVPWSAPPMGPSTGADGVAGLQIGIDIQRIDELLADDLGNDLKSSPALNSMFTLRELSYAQSKSTARDTLGGLFAAKEALRKCDARLLAVPLIELEVLPDAAGRPTFPGYALSISHSGGFAIAVAAAATAATAATAAAAAALPAPMKAAPFTTPGSLPASASVPQTAVPAARSASGNALKLLLVVAGLLAALYCWRLLR